MIKYKIAILKKPSYSTTILIIEKSIRDIPPPVCFLKSNKYPCNRYRKQTNPTSTLAQATLLYHATLPDQN